MPPPADVPADDATGDDDGAVAAVALPDTGDSGETGKLKMIVQLVKRCLGVKDIAAMRLSLPASLLEPIPNLEYWHYLDRPDLFAAINDSADPFERMLAVIRFTFSKDLKHIRGKVCKPYNSVLGEHFRAHWDVIPVTYPDGPSEPPTQHLFLSSPAPPSARPTPAPSGPPSAAASPRLTASTSVGASETASIKSERSARSGGSASMFSVAPRMSLSLSQSTAATSPVVVETNLDAQVSNLNLADDEDDVSDDTPLVEGEEPPAAVAAVPRVRTVFLTEQVSHHPPVSAYYAACPARGVALSGIDQISAKVSGTTVRVAPGALNKGVFVHLTHGAATGEQYHITHPVANVNGILRGSFYVTMGDATIITCSGGPAGQKLRAVIEYKEESWLGKAQFLVEGVIHTYTPGEAGVDDWTRVKHIPRARIVAHIDGSWRHLLRWRKATAVGASPRDPPPAWTPLVDLSTLHVIPKAVRPLERQDGKESRRLWESVTTRLERKEFGEANRSKQVIEQRQRDDAAERRRAGVEFVPTYFERDIDSGIPTLTATGRKAIEEELREESPHPLEPAVALDPAP